MVDDWRQSLRFSERLGVITEITSAYQSSDPSLSQTEAKTLAKVDEDQARKDALSLDEYHALCSKKALTLLSEAPLETPEDHHADEHVSPNLPEHGARLGRYTNAHHFEDGIYSEVFKAASPDKDERGQHPVVALKVTNPSMMTPPHDSAREARILTEAQSRNVITLVETFQLSGGRLVLVFPFKQWDLVRLMRENKLTPSNRLPILHDILTALAHIHARGIIHRDLKPANILLSTPQGPAYLADFGIAWSPTPTASSSSEPADRKITDVGTTSYRPPELLFGNTAYGTKLDMWAAGCTAAQILSLGLEPLFDAGDLGSELALIRSVFSTLGTPDLDVWPEAATYPDWGKMNFKQYPAKTWEQILPGTRAEARDLVAKLVVYESGKRLSAEEALQHPYFTNSS
ncbi:hypothetical protein MBLNU230_g0867t1 [Neophaeotheca triangularis]